MMHPNWLCLKKYEVLWGVLLSLPTFISILTEKNLDRSQPYSQFESILASGAVLLYRFVPLLSRKILEI